MAGTGSIRIIKRPPPARIRHKFVRDQIQRELIPIAQEHVKRREEIVSDFDTDINFGYRISTTSKQITLSILVENSEDEVSDGFSVGDLWRALDRTGTRGPYPIPKKIEPGKRLAFRTNYQPHTRPIGRFGGPGQATGPLIRPVQVTHPGIKPRKFSEKINKALRKRFEKAISRGVLLGWRKVR